MMLRGLMLLIAILGMAALPASAHQLKQSVTELNWRLHQQRLEVVHGLHLDDAMALLALFKAHDGVVTPAVGAQLLLYVEQHFGLTIDGEVALLEAVGAEVDGDYLYIYQEMPMAVPPGALVVENRLMHDFFPDQQNLVNWVIADEVRTLPLNVSRPSAVLRLER